MKNLFLFIADALRYDYAPKSIANSGTSILTLAPSLATPESISSILSGRNVIKHNVRTFFDILNPEIPTVFKFFPHASYYDHPKDPMVLKVLRKHVSKQKELTEMEEPFVWVERALDTHWPYGNIKHGNEIGDESAYGHNLRSRDQIMSALMNGKIDAVREYMKGVESVEQHFWTHIDELKNMGVYRRTLAIFTSDHGELLGEYGRYTHGYPPCRELVQVPTVFINTELNIKFMRSIDIIPTALRILGLNYSLDGCDGLDVRKEKPIKGINYSGETITLWKYKNGKLSLVKYYRKGIPIPIQIVMFSRKLADYDIGIQRNGRILIL